MAKKVASIYGRDGCGSNFGPVKLKKFRIEDTQNETACGNVGDR